MNEPTQSNTVEKIGAANTSKVKFVAPSLFEDLKQKFMSDGLSEKVAENYATTQIYLTLKNQRKEGEKK